MLKQEKKISFLKLIYSLVSFFLLYNLSLFVGWQESKYLTQDLNVLSVGDYIY